MNDKCRECSFYRGALYVKRGEDRVDGYANFCYGQVNPDLTMNDLTQALAHAMVIG